MNLIDVCFACHEHIHRNPKWATERGLLLHAWDQETPYATLVGGERVRATAEQWADRLAKAIERVVMAGDAIDMDDVVEAQKVWTEYQQFLNEREVRALGSGH